MSDYTGDMNDPSLDEDMFTESAADDAALHNHADATDALLEQDVSTEDFFTDYRIEYGGRTFVIGKPSIQTIIKIANLIGKLGLRSNKRVAMYLAEIYDTITKKSKRDVTMPNTALFFALFAVLEEPDLVMLSSILLFGGTDKQLEEGKAFHAQLGDDIELTPVIKAFAYRLHQSDDLRAALGNLPLIGAAMPKSL